MRDREATKRRGLFGIENTVPSNVTRQLAGKRHSTSPIGAGVQECLSAIGGVHRGCWPAHEATRALLLLLLLLYLRSLRRPAALKIESRLSCSPSRSFWVTALTRSLFESSFCGGIWSPCNSRRIFSARPTLLRVRCFLTRRSWHLRAGSSKAEFGARELVSDGWAVVLSGRSVRRFRKSSSLIIGLPWIAPSSVKSVQEGISESVSRVSWSSDSACRLPQCCGRMRRTRPSSACA
jgi:hypothetical protein